MKMPACTSSHSAGLSGLPAPSSRAAILASRPVLRCSTLWAASFACISAWSGSTFGAAASTDRLTARCRSRPPRRPSAARPAWEPGGTAAASRPRPTPARPPYIQVSGISSPRSAVMGAVVVADEFAGAPVRTAANASATRIVSSVGSDTEIGASELVTDSGSSAVTSTCRASTSASWVKALRSASGSASMTRPPAESASSSRAALAAPAWSRATTSSRTSASLTSLVTSPRAVSLVSAPSESTSTERCPSVPAMSTAARTPS